MKKNNSNTNKKDFVKKFLEDKKEIHKAIREGKSLAHLSKLRNIGFSKPI